MRGLTFLAMSLALAFVLTAPAHAQDQVGACQAQAPRQTGTRNTSAQSPVDALAAANRAARQRPTRAGFIEARQVYSYAPGAIYELYANPSFVSTILLEPGETLTDIAAGDTSRWMVTETNAEMDADARTIVLVKPHTANLRTNIVLITDRRTYLVEAISQGGAAYSAQIGWCYPDVRPNVQSASRLNFEYRIRTVRGDRPAWMPTRAYDDGRRTWIEMPADVAASDLPPLFVITSEGAELVNYRVQGSRYMIDRVFDRAELRLGTHAPIVVRIDRRHRRAGSDGERS